MGATFTILVGLGLYTLFFYYKSRINEQDDSIDYSEEEQQREIVPTTYTKEHRK